MENSTKAFRYDLSGHWYKGNTHLHSTASDGGKGFKELAELYHSAGFDFLFRTDHWVTSNSEEDPEKYPLLWLDGVELDGKDHTGADFHVVCLGRVTDLDPEAGLEAGLQAARQQGAMTILAHPGWCGNSLEDWRRWQFDGVEVYNHICQWLNGKGNGLAHWNASLRYNPNVLASSVDDGHLVPEHPGWNGGWIMVNAPECTRGAITQAIRKGNFYASRGPQFQAIELEGSYLHLETSPVCFIRLVGDRWNGDRSGSFDGKLITKASFKLEEDWHYFYVEIEDPQGRTAWTNNLFAA